WRRRRHPPVLLLGLFLGANPDRERRGPEHRTDHIGQPWGPEPSRATVTGRYGSWSAERPVSPSEVDQRVVHAAHLDVLYDPADNTRPSGRIHGSHAHTQTIGHVLQHRAPVPVGRFHPREHPARVGLSAGEHLGQATMRRRADVYEETIR